MARIRADYVFGTLSAGIDADDTAISSASLARLPVVTGSDVAAVTLHDGDTGAYEIVHVTAHAAGATTATVLRAQEGSTAATWASGSNWTHGLTATDIGSLSGAVSTYLVESGGSYPARPTPGEPVIFVGTTDPIADMIEGDVWIDTDPATTSLGLDDLADVDLTTPPTDGQVLVYDTATSTFKPETPAAGGGATDLDDLTDVDLTAPPTDGQALVYDTSSSTWKPETVGGATDISARAYKTADQSIATATVTTVTFNAESYDTAGLHDNATNNSRLTIPVGQGGKYLVNAGVSWAAFGSAGQAQIRLLKNGSLYELAVGSGSAAGSQSSLTDVLDLAAGDYLEVAVYHADGVSRNVAGGTTASTFFSVKKL